MKRRSVLLICLVLLSAATYLSAPRIASASAMCNTTCSSGIQLRCCTSGTCSTVSGSSVNCNGTTLSCGPVDSWSACRSVCFANDCTTTCEFPFECRMCQRELNQCLSECGPTPTTNIGC